jgi:hypothetical protein
VPPRETRELRVESAADASPPELRPHDHFDPESARDGILATGALPHGYRLIIQESEQSQRDVLGLSQALPSFNLLNAAMPVGRKGGIRYLNLDSQLVGLAFSNNQSRSGHLHHRKFE